jgi:pimeloyl-ACP methyl ester carboxylesterase
MLLLFLSTILLHFTAGCKLLSPPRFLEYIFYEESQPRNIIFIHGSFGTATQLFPFANDDRIKKLANSYLITMPNHGNSYDDPNFSLDSISDDVVQFIRKRRLRSVYLVGHSLGAFVAMNVAAKYGCLIEGVLALDFLPFGINGDFLAPFMEFLNKFRQVPANQTLAEIQSQIFALLPDKEIAQALSSGLEGTEGNYQWTFNMYNYFSNVDKLLFNPIPKIPFYGKFKIVLGLQSTAYDKRLVSRLPEYYPKIQPEKDVIYVNSGHIVYSDFFDVCVQALVDLLE